MTKLNNIECATQVAQAIHFAQNNNQMESIIKIIKNDNLVTQIDVSRVAVGQSINELRLYVSRRLNNFQSNTLDWNIQELVA